MIVNLRGTSGSGKSTIARAVMDGFTVKTRMKVKDRKQPIGYTLSAPRTNWNGASPDRMLYIPGHYETDCGGCDTINSMDLIYDHVRRAVSSGMDVFFEGLLLSSEFNRTLALHQDFPGQLVVVGLNLPLQDCLDGVNGRRQAKYTERLVAAQNENIERLAAGRKTIPLPEPRGDVNPKNTESKWKATKSVMDKLAAAGVRCEWGDRAEAQRLVQRHLGLLP